jgi:hypothetical protein
LRIDPDNQQWLSIFLGGFNKNKEVQMEQGVNNKIDGGRARQKIYNEWWKIATIALSVAVTGLIIGLIIGSIVRGASQKNTSLTSDGTAGNSVSGSSGTENQKPATDVDNNVTTPEKPVDNRSLEEKLIAVYCDGLEYSSCVDGRTMDDVERDGDGAIKIVLSHHISM